MSFVICGKLWHEVHELRYDYEAYRIIIEPGGYLQWNEVDLGTFFAITVNPSASKAAATELVAKWKSECAKSGIVFE